LLREQGLEVVVLDSMEFGHEAAVGDAPLIRGDIADVSLVKRLAEEYRVNSVVHFAAYKSPAESMAKPERYFTNNTAKTAILFGALRDLGINRVVLSSTCAVYGNPHKVPVSEKSPIAPESPYGESKAMSERSLRWFDHCVGLRSVSLRYFNAAGAWEDGSIGEDWSATINLIPLLMKAALGKAKPLQVYGTDYPTPDGSAIRDYVHVVDLASAHLAALRYLDEGGQTTAVNLGTGRGVSVLEVLSAAENLIGRRVPHRLSTRRPGDPIALYADNQRARDLLGWRPQRGLVEILESAWAWHSTHLDGYGS
jgi:UDP-glucose-4-epimerase GalE